MAEIFDVIIVGAGPAGLSCAATLQCAGLTVQVLERAGAVGESWRNHYDRLHLHTSKKRSGLPMKEMPEDYPRYPSRAQVVEFLEDYASGFEIQPIFNADVKSITRDGNDWKIKFGRKSLKAKSVIVAAGNAIRPKRPEWPGMDDFKGEIVHSQNYKNPKPYKGRKTLVVGFGNSGGEIALDLAEHKVECGLCVRGAVNIIPRELFGVPIQELGFLQKIFPYRVVDAINRPVLASVIGSYAKLGLRKAPKGPLAMIVEDKRIPLIDIGTLDAVRRGEITVHPAIKRFVKDGVEFENGETVNYERVILATGYQTDLRDMLPEVSAGVLDGQGAPIASGVATSENGLYFCGYSVTPSGLLFTIKNEAENLATLISGKDT
ncbi:MAG: NAD(P)/FAD-dependent oxidoreductase [Rhizobiaceae bacterium]|nr:NAD(P)/FAD-dependent oxidoreductase [Rhizobiaceae bacterium]